MAPTVYLAGKMDGLTDEEIGGWRYVAAENLIGFEIMDPADFYFNIKKYYPEGEPTPREITDNNKWMIQQSTVVLAEMDHDAPSVGTVSEVIYARTIGKPVIIWGTSPSMKTPWIIEHSTRQFDRLEDAVGYLIDFYCR